MSRRHTRAGNDYEHLSFDLNTSYTWRLGDRVTNVTQLGVNVHRNETQAFTATAGPMRWAW